MKKYLSVMMTIATFLGVFFLFFLKDSISDKLVKDNMVKEVELNQSEVSQSDADYENGRDAILKSMDDDGGFSKPQKVLDKHSFSAIALFETHDKSIASAVVLIDGYGAYRYRISDSVIDEYVIKDILPDHVVIGGREGEFRVYLAPLSGEEAKEVSVSDPVVSGENILDETKARRERMRLLSTYDIYPVSDDSAAGYIIGERFSPEVMKATGAKPGDIVLMVNGYNVGAPEEDELALRSFRTTMKASVLIQRSDGSTFYFHYPDGSESP